MRRPLVTHDAVPAPTAKPSPSSRRQDIQAIMTASMQTAASQWALLFVLVFGGCCSNAWAMERVTAENPRSGALVTFAQYLLVALFGLRGRFTITDPAATTPATSTSKTDDSRAGSSSISTLPRLRLKPLAVPISRWLVQVILFLAVSLLNNAAFAYHVPMAVHIVFRSGGLVVNMILGYLTQGRRYTRLQVLSVLMVSAGVLAATTAGSHVGSSTRTTTRMTSIGVADYTVGIFMLSLALVLATFLGFAQEKTYGKYGRHWEEGMFFLHFLALPMFAFMGHDLKEQISWANATPKVDLARSVASLLGVSLQASSPTPDASLSSNFTSLPRTFPSFAQKNALSLLPRISVPSFWIPFTLNLATQLVCVSGVNRLTARVSSLTVILILSVRKAISLVISVVFIGGGAGTIGLWAGSSAVLFGTVMYSLAPRPAVAEERKKSS